MLLEFLSIIAIVFIAEFVHRRFRGSRESAIEMFSPSWNYLKIVLTIGLLYVSFLEFLIVFIETDELDYEVIMCIARMYMFYACFIVPALFLWLVYVCNERSWAFLRPTKLSFREIFFLTGKWIVPLYSLMFVLDAVLDILKVGGDRRSGMEELLDLVLEAGEEGIVKLLLLGGMTLWPVVEEVLFRGILYQFFRSRLGFIPAVVFSSVLFASGHGPDPYYLFDAFMFGCIFCIIVEKSGSLRAPIFVHVCNNAMMAICYAIKHGI